MRRIWSGWTWRRAALGAAAVAVAVGGGFGVSALTGKATAAPAPPKLATAHADNEDEAKKAWLGIFIAQLNAEIAGRLGITQTSGVVIMDVPQDSPAAQAGVQRADVLLKVNGTDVADVKAARAAIEQAKPGDAVALTVSRSGQEQAISVIAGERPSAPKIKAIPPMMGIGLGLPRLKELEGIPPDEMFSHMQGGTMTLTDKDGKPVTVTVTFGKVTAVDTAAPSVMVQPNAGGSPVTYTVGADTQIHGRVRELVQLKVDDKVTVVTVNGSSEARMITATPDIRKGGARPMLPGRGGPRPGATLESLPLFEGMTGDRHFAWFSPADGLGALEEFATERAEVY